jgi:hypothetical protein
VLVTVRVAVAGWVARWVVGAAALWVVLVAGGAEAGDVVGRAAGDVVGRAAACVPLVVLLPRASATWEDEDEASSNDGAPPQALRPIAPARARATREGIRITGCYVRTVINR